MRFRLDPNNILKLCELAQKKRQHVGAMVRTWVLERMAAEINLTYSSTNSKTTDPLLVAEGLSYPNAAISTMSKRLDSLEKEIKRLAKNL